MPWNDICKVSLTGRKVHWNPTFWLKPGDMQLDMVDEMLQKSEFSLYVLHLCYIKFHFDYMFHIYVI